MRSLEIGKFDKNYIHVLYDCVEFSVCLVLILGVLFSVLILFLEFGCLGLVYFLICFQFVGVCVLYLVIFYLYIVFMLDSLFDCVFCFKRKEKKRKIKKSKKQDPKKKTVYKLCVGAPLLFFVLRRLLFDSFFSFCKIVLFLLVYFVLST